MADEAGRSHAVSEQLELEHPPIPASNAFRPSVDATRLFTRNHGLMLLSVLSLSPLTQGPRRPCLWK